MLRLTFICVYIMNRAFKNLFQIIILTVYGITLGFGYSIGNFTAHIFMIARLLRVFDGCITYIKKMCIFVLPLILFCNRIPFIVININIQL